MSTASRQVFLSGSFVICCGTVSVDIPNQKVLLIRNDRNGKIVLPKGRKDVGETLEAAAIRETYEETGYRCKLLPLVMDSWATGLTDDPSMTEPFAMSQRPVVAQRPRPDDSRWELVRITKVVFWFVGEVDCSLPQAQGTQMPSESFSPVWASFDKAAEMPAFDDDKKVVAKAIELVKRNLSREDGV